MGKMIDLKGKRFGRLNVLEYAESKYRLAYWKCRCDCGTVKVIRGSHLTQGLTKSCGCLSKETTAKRSYKHGYTVNREVRPEHRIWQGMINRCDNKKLPSYKDYGGRGISVCERWKDFKNFIDDMGERPSPSHTIERKDVNGNYEPNNCMWASRKEQNINRRLFKSNKSGHKGVMWHKHNKKWFAVIVVDYKRIHLGYYDDLNEAIEARKNAEEKYWGEN